MPCMGPLAEDDRTPIVSGGSEEIVWLSSKEVISADRARRFDTLRGAPARPSASAIRNASIPHHRAPSAFRTLRTMPAESVGCFGGGHAGLAWALFVYRRYRKI